MTHMFADGTRPRKTKRDALDRYETPEWVTLALLSKVTFVGPILEPAAGTGRMVRILNEQHGFPVASSDISRGRDFLKRRARATNIVTNPPIRNGLDEAFVRHAVELADGKVAMLLLSRFFWSNGRREWHEAHPCCDVVFITDRIIFQLPNGKPIAGQFFDFAWYVWDVGKIRQGLLPVGVRHHFVGRPDRYPHDGELPL